MAELQNMIKACVHSADAFFSAENNTDSNSTYAFVRDIYKPFLKHAWCELPLHNSDGSALATVSCMSLWELLNQHTCTGVSTTPQANGFAAQALTSMYPKSMDRRCLFQQLNCVGSSAATSVPLSTHVPLEMDISEILSTDGNKEYVSASRFIAQFARSGNWSDEKEKSSVVSATRSFLSSTLPKCVLQDAGECSNSVSNGKIAIIFGGSSSAWNSGQRFLLTLWYFLLVSSFLCTNEAKELATFLKSSRWASQRFTWRGNDITYSRFVSPLVEVCALCVAANPRAPSTSTDTAPLIDPRVLTLLCGEEASVASTHVGAVLESSHERRFLYESTTSLAEQKAESVSEQLNSDIPNEVDFMGSSSSCRDFDQLAYLCRDLFFLSSAQKSIAGGDATARQRDLLFSRKRARDAANSDGPCLIPVSSSISAVMEKADVGTQVPLERLCMDWKKK